MRKGTSILLLYGHNIRFIIVNNEELAKAGGSKSHLPPFYLERCRIKHQRDGSQAPGNAWNGVDIYRNGREITDEQPAEAFGWKRSCGNSEADAE